MATFTASTVPNVAKAVHVGLNVVHSNFTYAATGTADSTILLVKVPNRAKIVDFQFYGSVGSDDNVADIGFSASPSALMAGTSTTGGVAVRGTNVLLPYTVNLTDQDWTWVQLKNSAAFSSSALSKFTIYYTMDDTP